MDYERVYRELIADRRGKQTGLVVRERHHVLPRCLGGSDAADNLVDLTPGDHLFAHVLLARIHGGVLATVALWMLNQQKYQGRRSRSHFTFLRQGARQHMLGNKRGLNPSQETRVRQASRLGVPMPREAVERIRLAAIGRKHTPEAREKMRLAKLGRPMPVETRLKISATLRER